MRIRATLLALVIMTTAAVADPAPPPAPHVPTADEKAAMLDQIDQRINTMNARVMGTLTSLHDNIMQLNAANLKASEDLATANSALEIQKGLVAALTKERDELKAKTESAPVKE